MITFFHSVDRDRSGKINANELRTVLVNGQNQHFSEHCCRLLISLFDSDKNGTVDVNGFTKLYSYVNDWLRIFRQYDNDDSKAIDEAELSKGIFKINLTSLRNSIFTQIESNSFCAIFFKQDLKISNLLQLFNKWVIDFPISLSSFWWKKMI